MASPGPGAGADPERPAIRLGPFELRPRLALTNMGVDNNVFNDGTDPKRDFTFTAIPDLEVSVHPGRLRLAYNTGTEFVYFHEYTSERSLESKFRRDGGPRSHHPETVCRLHLRPDQRAAEFRNRRARRASAANLLGRDPPQARVSHRDGVHRA